MPAHVAPVLVQAHRRRRSFLYNAPQTVTGLRHWLKADALPLGHGDPVALWPDASGSGNDLAQSNAAKRPTFRINQLNGRPVVRFDGVDDTLFKVALGGFAATQGHTIMAVLNPTAAVSFGMAVVTRPGFTELRQTLAGGVAQWLAPSGSTLVNGLATLTGSWKVWTGCYAVAGQRLELFINGTSQGFATDAGTLAVGDGYLGSRADSFYWLGEMAEVLVYDAALAVADRQTVESYLTAKYSLT